MHMSLVRSGLILLLGYLFTAVSLSMAILRINVKVIDGGILVQWNYTGHVIGTIRNYRVTYVRLPDLNVTNIIVDSQTSFALIATTDHPGRLYNISVQAETNRGLIQISRSRFTRAGCGKRLYLPPKSTKSIESPHYPNMYEPGVFCKWTVFTNNTYALGYYLKDIDFGQNRTGCHNSLLSVRIAKNRRYLCYSNTTVQSRASELEVIFQSGSKSDGHGFQLFLKSEVKSAGPPSNIIMKAVTTGISVYWSEPEGNYLPLTSYTLIYTSLPDGTTHKLMLSSQMSRYYIITIGHEGQLFLISISANIGNTYGVPAKLYFRAPCSRLIHLSNEEIFNVTSPSYPFSYPRGISCTWRISAQNAGSIELKILDMDIQDDVFCSSDYLTISTQTEKLCGSLTYPKVIRSLADKVDIRFFSDGDKTGKGFFIQAKILAPKTTPSTTVLSTSTETLSTRTTKTTLEYTQSQITQNFNKTFLFSTENTFMPGNTQIVSTKNYAKTTEQSKNNTHIRNTLSVNRTIARTHKTSVWIFSPTSTRSTTGKNDMSAVTTIITSPTVDPISNSNTATAQNVNSSVGEFSGTYFEPNLENITHPIYFNLKLRRSNIQDDDEPVSTIKNRIQLKLIETFNDTEMFKDLIIDAFEDPARQIISELYILYRKYAVSEKNVCRISRDNETATVHFTIRYDLEMLLKYYLQNTDFRLVAKINKTNLQVLSHDPNIDDDWTIDSDYLQSFRLNELGLQEINTPCDTLQKVCCCNYTCMRMNTSSFGVVCCRNCIAYNNLSCQNSGNTVCMTSISTTTAALTMTDFSRQEQKENNTILIIIIVSIFSITVIVTSGLYVYRKRQQCSKVDVKDTSRRGCIEMHDILLQSSYIGDKNVEFTAFKFGRKSKQKKRMGGSLPSRNNKQYKIDDDIESKTKQLGLFIEDREALKKRLQLKTARRRGNSF